MTTLKFGRYQIVSELGRGGMATVYLAHDPRFNRQVAIKVLPLQFSHDPQFLGRFQRESETIAALEHQNIVPVYDYGEQDDLPYLVLRYMPGGSLGDRIGQGPIPLQQTIEILRPIAAALDYAHERGVVHRDVKPGNILFDQSGGAYLSDFGIVRLAEATTAFTGSSIIGTPAYMSPEQVTGGTEIDGRSDVYSLGIPLYEMLAGAVPYKGETPTQQLMKHVLEPVPRISQANPDLPSEVEAVLMRALAKDREQRYSMAGALVDALERSLSPQPRLPIQQRQRVSGTIVAGAGALLVLLLGVIIIVATQLGKPSASATATATLAVVARASDTPETPTDTPVYATATATPMPPSDTPTPPINSPTPSYTPASALSNMPFPVSSNTPASALSNIPMPVPKGEPIPAILNISVSNFDIIAEYADGRTVNLTESQPTGSCAYPDLSPDNMRVVFACSVPGAQIFVMNADGSGLTQLTNSASGNTTPVWSPDGNRIAFVSLRDGNREIYAINADGSREVNLTMNPAHDVNPAWSADGTQIFFESDRGLGKGGLSRWVMNADGSGQAPTP